DFWAPTPASDAWLDGPPARRWTVLAMVWLDLDRMPWMIGMRDANDKPLAALSAELRVPYAPRDRRAILGLLAEQPSGTALDPADLGRVLAWRQPRRRRHFRREAVEHTIAEASALGLLGRGALAPAARALLHETVSSAADAEAEMDAALPDPVDHVLVQADLTVIAPGPLVGELAKRMALVADIESAGAATVCRSGADSVRRALDAGLTAAELHSLFATRSRTPVPQALTYLIDDVARRHGQLRAGMAQSFVRSDDPALLAQVLSAPVADLLALRAVAPTVAIAQAPLGEGICARAAPASRPDPMPGRPTGRCRPTPSSWPCWWPSCAPVSGQRGRARDRRCARTARGRARPPRWRCCNWRRGRDGRSTSPMSMPRARPSSGWSSRCRSATAGSTRSTP